VLELYTSPPLPPEPVAMRRSAPLGLKLWSSIDNADPSA
jgi:hypothetical protein